MEKNTNKQKNTFDTIMDNCPFLKETIINKINSEVEPLKKEVNDLKAALYAASVLPEKQEK